MRSDTLTDGTVAVLFSRVPSYSRWTNEPLGADARRVLSEADEQQLMSIAVDALMRLERRQMQQVALRADR